MTDLHVNLDMFASSAAPRADREELYPGAFLLPGHALDTAAELAASVAAIAAQAPFRHMTTPGGFRMSVAMSNCGTYGWLTDRRGYRYGREDPDSGRPWPPMPASFLRLACSAAARAGFTGFDPDACLINRYEAGARMSLHQDRNEREFSEPIVSVSLGLPAMFLLGGLKRSDKPLRVPLRHGDVVVWGGPARLRFHGVMPLRAGHHAAFGASRINLTFRRAGH